MSETTTEAPKKKSLYHIREDHAAIIAQIEDQDGEITNEQLAALDLNGQDFNDKAISIAYAIRKARTRAAEAKAEKERCEQHQKSWENLEKKLKEYLITGMVDLGVRRVDSATLKMWLSPIKKVNITDMSLLPDYAKTQPKAPPMEPNKTHIKALIERGDTVPGAELVNANSITIK